MIRDCVVFISRKLLAVISVFSTLFRRALCFIRRRPVEDVLPYTIPKSDETLPDNNWDSFDPAVCEQQRRIEHFYRQRAEQQRKASETAGGENEPDFFSQMQLQPQMQKTKKIIVKPTTSADEPVSPSSRFAFQSSVDPNLSSELGDLIEPSLPQVSDSWDFEEDEVNPDAVLKQARQKEREARRQQRLAQRSAS